MTPQARRRLIPVLVLLAAAGVLLAVIFGPKGPNSQEQPGNDDIAYLNTDQGETTVDAVEETESKTTYVAPLMVPERKTPDGSSHSFDNLGLISYAGEGEPITLGSLTEVDSWQMEAQFTRAGAGIASIRFSNIFDTVNGKLRWQQYRMFGGDEPDINDLYLLATSTELAYLTPSGKAFATASVLGASQIIIDGNTLHLTSPAFWNVANTTSDSVTFEAVVIDENENPVAKIIRSWTLDSQYGIELEQSVLNTSSVDINVQWLQYGPASLTVDRSRYMDRRRFRFGWELSDEFDPNQVAPIQSNDFLF
ncbi:MAG TPA: hypothetical protein EYM64_05190 [Phycisphaerales bacterium]|nr:hypothetical protein [Phycisphaerales bacterium]